MPAALAHLTWWQWLEPLPAGVNLVLMALYLYVTLGSGQRWFPGATRPRPRQVAAFLLGIFSVYLAFGGPLDILADGYLFSAHMAQHSIEAMASAPLLLLGTPDWLIRPVLKWRPTGWLLSHMVRPLIALLLFNVVFGLVVWPPLYALMEQNGAVHFLVHAAILITALAMWWPLLSPLPELPRLHPGLQLLYLFADGIPMLLPFVLVILDSQPLYTAVYAHAPRLFGLSLIGDQQLGGTLCLMTVHIAYGAAFIAAFQQWVRQERDKRVDPAIQRAREPIPFPQGRTGQASVDA